MRRPRVVVLDYGSGNLHSVTRALAAADAEVTLSAAAADAEAADGLVVPGVGAFAACMDQLVAIGGDKIIADRVAAGRPLLGICVGHQILFAAGDEHGIARPGLGVFPGLVTKVPATRLPHMGWNTVAAPAGSRLFTDVGDDHFYFVHSYGALHASDCGPDAAIGWTHHDGAQVVASVEVGPVSSVQFHPEKSGAAGGRLLQNWLASL